MQASPVPTQAVGRPGPPPLSRSVSPRQHPSVVTGALVALTVVGTVLRVIAANQSLLGDELSTYWISATHGLGGVLSLLYGSGRIAHAEITPPLSFLASWLTTRFGDSFVLLRLPSLIAGAATIPLVYLLGARTVGRRAALVAAALTTLSPFMIFYSSEARAYALMMSFVVVATLSMLLALDTGRARWWVLYAVSSCAAFYSHYTCLFVLGAQLVWLLWVAPQARRAALLANVGAVAGVIPWLPGLINDLNSPTLKILSALSPLTTALVRFDLAHWAIGYPNTLRRSGSPRCRACSRLCCSGAPRSSPAAAVHEGRRRHRCAGRQADLVCDPARMRGASRRDRGECARRSRPRRPKSSLVLAVPRACLLGRPGGVRSACGPRRWRASRSSRSDRRGEDAESHDSSARSISRRPISSPDKHDRGTSSSTRPALSARDR